MVYDVNTRHMDQIPSLQSSENSFPSDSDCGIHAIEINPSRTLLATGAKNASDVAIYRLPTLDPILVGEVSFRSTVSPHKVAHGNPVGLGPCLARLRFGEAVSHFSSPLQHGIPLP